jgi:hypothetical protein
MSSGNDGGRFARLPGTEAERSAEGRATREAITGWWED